jgi:hypothetical protein
MKWRKAYYYSEGLTTGKLPICLEDENSAIL